MSMTRVRMKATGVPAIFATSVPTASGAKQRIEFQRGREYEVSEAGAEKLLAKGYFDVVPPVAIVEETKTVKPTKTDPLVTAPEKVRAVESAEAARPMRQVVRVGKKAEAVPTPALDALDVAVANASAADIAEASALAESPLSDRVARKSGRRQPVRKNQK